MVSEASRAVELFGTEEPVAAAPILRAGPLTCMLDAGNLRYLKLAGKEAIRAIAFIVRDKNWGTYNPEITDLRVDQRADGFTVTYDALAKDASQAFRYACRIEGRPDGSLVFEGRGEALSDFVTNRTGFVILHPLDGVAGEPVEVLHVDGRTVPSRFPALIDPQCPFQDIRALTHEVMPGVKVRLTMEGDTWEMEDHRNWMDASYKTYVRPLALPWPYTIAKGEKLDQRVMLEVLGKVPQAASSGAGPEPVTVVVEGLAGVAMPKLGLAVPAEHARAALEKAELLREARPAFLVGHFDARHGHDAGHVQDYDQLARRLGAALVLEIVLPCRDAAGKPTADLDVLRRDLNHVKGQIERVGVRPARVTVSPACDLKCTLPGSVFPPAPSWQDLFRLAREAFPKVPVGGGMFSYYTELNRKRPPADVLDFIGHTGCPLVHAGDDITMTENLEALPWQYRSVRAFAPGTPYWIFPTAISMRDNPYGEVPAENPSNIRQAMNRVDPRERGLIGAAWYAGYLAHAIRAGLDAVTLAAAAGPSGIVYTRQTHAQPWFDEDAAPVYPSWHVFKNHADQQDGSVLATRSSAPRDVQITAVGWRSGMRLVVSNLTGEPRSVRLEAGSGRGRLRLLDETSFALACRDPEAFDASARDIELTQLELRPYAVAFVDTEA